MRETRSERATAKALQEQSIRQRLEQIDVESIPVPFVGFGKYLRRDMKRWENMVKEGRLE
jgi:hypothetical protein